LAWSVVVFAAESVPVTSAPRSAASASKVNPKEAEASIAQLRAEQSEILSQVRREIAAMPPGDPVLAEKLRLLATIEKEINDENRYPRRRYISPVTVQEPYVAYYHALMYRIEDQGTRNYPQANGHRLYGDLVMNITVDRQGRVVEVDMVHGSGNAVLDRRAQQIARSAAPFGAFSEAMRKMTDQIVVTARFRFTHVQPSTSGEAASNAASEAGLARR
jgi:protein TonB